MLCRSYKLCKVLVEFSRSLSIWGLARRNAVTQKEPVSPNTNQRSLPSGYLMAGQASYGALGLSVCQCMLVLYFIITITCLCVSRFISTDAMQVM